MLYIIDIAFEVRRSGELVGRLVDMYVDDLVELLEDLRPEDYSLKAISLEDKSLSKFPATSEFKIEIRLKLAAYLRFDKRLILWNRFNGEIRKV